jgi:hypothetical protein
MDDIRDSILSKGFQPVDDEIVFPKGGITLADIDTFISEAKQAGHELEGKCTGAVNDIMLSLTKAENRSYCEYLGRKNDVSVRYIFSRIEECDSNCCYCR